MATQNLGSILVRSVQFGEKGPVLRRGDDGAQTITTQNGELADAGHIIEDEGVPLANQPTLNFVGAGVTVTDAGGKTIVTIPLGVSDHGGLTGLADDDHLQYHTDARGDARYYTQTQLDADQLTQYALLVGRSGGQTLIGGTGVQENLTLRPTSNANEGFILVSSVQDTISKEVLRLRSTRATRAVNDEIFQSWYQPDNVGGQHEFGRITNAISAVGAGSEGGRTEFAVSCQNSGGTLQEFFRIDGSSGNEAFLFNPTGSADFDFRCMTGSEAFLFNINSGFNTVGIGGIAITGTQLVIEEDSNSASVNVLRLAGRRSTPIVNDRALVDWFLNNSVSTNHNFARIGVVATTITSGGEGGQIDLSVSCPSSGGGLVRFMSLDGTAQDLTINPDASNIVNFIVESTANPRIINVEAGTNSVGLGGLATTNNFLKIIGGLNSRGHANLQGYLVDFEADTFTDSGAGAFANHHAIIIGRPTISTAATTGTTSAATLYIENSPAVTGGGSITNPFALHVDAGTTRLDGFFLLGGPAGSTLIESSATQLVINEAGADIDIRIEGNTNPLLFEINAGFDTIGIGGFAQSTHMLTIEDPTDAASLAILRLASDRTTRTDNDELYMSFYVDTDTGVGAEYIRMTAIATDVSNASKASAWELQGFQSNAVVRPVRWFATAGVNVSSWDFNPDSVDMDFQIQGNNEAQLFYANAGLDVIGIGTVGNSGVLLSLDDDTNAADIEIMRFRSTRTVRADGDSLRFDFSMPGATGAQVETHSLNFEFTDVTNATARSRFDVITQNTGPETSFTIGRDATGAGIIGFLGLSAAQATYTRNATVVEDRTLLQSSAATTLNNNNVLAAIIADLQAHGMFLGT